MAGSTATSKALAYTPGVVASTVLTTMIGAVLPAAVGLAVFVLGLAVMVVLLAGAGEGLVVRVLFRARELTCAERSALAPAVAMLCQRGIGPPAVRLWVQGKVVPIRAGGAGRRSVVVSGGLVGAVRDGQLPPDQAAAVIAHGAGVVLSGAVRSDPALEFWTLPWQLVRGLARAVSRAFSGLPLLALAWKVRFIVGGVALVQAAGDGHPIVGAASAGVIALSYLIPRWERAWLVRLSELGDEQVCQAGLADALARFLRRCSGSPATHERIHALTGPAHQPKLAVVTSSGR